ncbi:MAG: 3-phosphoshikimate 1-carboxyvinyltransferase [Chlamydiae bacterium]|nr:3-phosphoshikimate 1-carboxyvinyltransferase [Chlamydiota bacterium]
MYIEPSQISGRLTPPPSKSHTQRALLFAMRGIGKSVIRGVLDSPDVEAMIGAISSLGASVSRVGDTIEILGGFSPSTTKIDAGNSGQVLRFIGSLAALFPTTTIITGDSSIQSRRPMEPLLSALRELGARAEKHPEGGYQITGPISAGTCHLSGEDSQPVSALLMATAFLQGPTEIIVDSPGELPWIDLTLDWLKRRGSRISHEHYSHYRVEGNLAYPGFTYTVPGDYSSAAYSIVGALITHCPLLIEGLQQGDVQGDRAIIGILQEMGAVLNWTKEGLSIVPSDKLRGMAIDVNKVIDALPILAVLGCYAKGKTTLYNGAIARKKESDRISAIAGELKKMGANITETPDGLVIEESSLRGGTLKSYDDHRIALSLAIAALGANGPTTIEGSDCIAKSYPTFVEDLTKLGGVIERYPVRV